MKSNYENERWNQTLMTPKNNKFYVWEEYFSFFLKQRQKDVAITNAGKKNAKENLNLKNFYCFYPNNDKQRSFYGFSYTRGIR